MMRGAWVLSTALLVVALPAPASADGALDAARAKWRAAKLGSYEYGYRKFCECHRDAPPETVVSVRDGKVVNVRHRPVGSTTEVPAAEKNFEYYWTVDGLFELIAAAEARHVEVRAQYDSTVGYPTEIHIDYDKNLIGDELDLKLTGVTPPPR
jgi:uncharacterized beta-barrel protein YwiB (DUF1934 family)